MSGAAAVRLRWHLICLGVSLLPALASAAGPAVRPDPKAPAVNATPSLDTVPPEPDASSFPRSALGDEGVRSKPDQSAGPAGPETSSRPEAMDYPRVLGALGIVIGLIFVLRWVGRHIFPASAGRGASRTIEVLSRSPLSPKQQVVLLRVGRRLVVVGDTGAQLNPLCEITDPDEIAALVGQIRDEKSSAPSAAFGAMFGRSRRRFESVEPPVEQPMTGLQDDEDMAPVTSAREELSGLRERVRMLSEQFKT